MCIFELAKVPNFSSNKQFWFFGSILLQEGIFGWQFSVNTTTEFCTFKLDTKFQFKLKTQNFGFLDQIYPKRVFLVENRKSEHHHCILHIGIGLKTKFQLRLTILIIWAKFAQKGCFQSKTENSHLCVYPWLFLPILNSFARGTTKRYL